MDNFEAARQELRNTPFYAEACQTEYVMYDWPYTYDFKRRPNIRDRTKITNAYRRMDCMIRHALFVDFNQTVMSPRHVSAIDDFMRFINETISGMSHPYETEVQLNRRLYLGKEILKISQAECDYYRFRQAVGSRWFEQYVNQAGYVMENVVYFNPFKRLYHSPGGFTAIGGDSKLIRFHSQMQYFWE